MNTEGRLGVKATGGFFVVIGLLSIINQSVAAAARGDSVLVALFFIITGIFLIGLKEFGRLSALFLSSLNVVYIIFFYVIPHLRYSNLAPQEYSICSLQFDSLSGL